MDTGSIFNAMQSIKNFKYLYKRDIVQMGNTIQNYLKIRRNTSEAMGK